MKNERGEISTIVILGTFLVVGMALLLNNAANQRNTSITQASGPCWAEPSSIQAGQTATLRWNFNDQTTRVFIGNIEFPGRSGSYNVNPTTTTTYRLVYSQPSGGGPEQFLPCDVTVNVSGGGAVPTNNPQIPTSTRAPTSQQIPTPTAPQGAGSGSCRNNPVSPPGGYIWIANCSRGCTVNADCPQNTGDPNVDIATSNWCYGFPDGPRCLQLQRESGQGGGGNVQNTPTPLRPTPTSPNVPITTPTRIPTLPPQSNECWAEPQTFQPGETVVLRWRFNDQTNNVIVDGTTYQGREGRHDVRPNATKTYRLNYSQPSSSGPLQYLYCDINVVLVSPTATPRPNTPTLTRSPSITQTPLTPPAPTNKTQKTPNIAIAPIEGGAGTRIFVAGADFNANETIYITIERIEADGSKVEATVALASTYDDGHFTAEFVFPYEIEWTNLENVDVVAYILKTGDHVSARFRVDSSPAAQEGEPPLVYGTNMEINGNACSGNRSKDYGCIDIYGIY